MILTLLACSPLPSTIAMSGAVSDAPYGEGDPLAGAGLLVLDSDEATVDEQTADGDGAFQVDVPAGVPFFLTVTADGHVPTAFSGTAGLTDFAAPEGYPWVAPTSWVDSLKETFADCPTAGEPGGIVAGEIRGYLEGVAYTDLPLVDSGTARVIDPDSVEYDACYLDDDGVYSPDATQVGATGRFVIFGVPAGSILVDVRFNQSDGSVPVQLFQFLAPDSGLVPLYPALVQVL